MSCKPETQGQTRIMSSAHKRQPANMVSILDARSENVERYFCMLFSLLQLLFYEIHRSRNPGINAQFNSRFVTKNPSLNVPLNCPAVLILVLLQGQGHVIDKSGRLNISDRTFQAQLKNFFYQISLL